MLEFVLFHQTPVDLFVEFLKENGITAEVTGDGEIFEIKFPEDIDDELAEKIEQKYDDLMAMNHELFHAENPETADNFRVATVMITLKNGDMTSAHIRPDLLGQVLEAISEEELNEIITAVVEAVENPDERTYCQKVRAGDVEFNGESDENDENDGGKA